MMPVEMHDQDLNQDGRRPCDPASAVEGTNVAATVKGIVSLTVASIRKEFL